MPTPAAGGGTWSAELSADERFVFVTDALSGVHVVDLTDPTQPLIVKSYNTRGAAGETALTPDGQSLVVADDSGGITVINLLEEIVSTDSDTASINVAPVNDLPALDGLTPLTILGCPRAERAAQRHYRWR